ncbi:hypothetical protein CVU75_02960 [Candidatus Dependentiae bacterium HGW-Dependentiae-1]|nr:MAG: hypothetical protein CVU75_02960 [Candidatus Dependentiae bacterium HGW-Dependentiae-1]
MTPHEHGVSAFMQVYQIFYQDVPPYNSNDFGEYFWFYPHELREKIVSGVDKAKSDLPLLLKYFFENK